MGGDRYAPVRRIMYIVHTYCIGFVIIEFQFGAVIQRMIQAKMSSFLHCLQMAHQSIFLEYVAREGVLVSEWIGNQWEAYQENWV